MEYKQYIQKFGRVGVLMGGYSSERNISLKSGNAIYEALKSQGIDVIPLDITENEREKIGAFIKNAQIDIAFNALHGKLGEDGEIQSILEELRILYTGSGIKASKLAINKIAAQECLKLHHVKVPDNFHFDSESSLAGLLKEVEAIGGFPVVVKPALEGSSIGINVVSSEDDFDRAVTLALELGTAVLVEKFIQGREFTVSIIDKQPLPVIEICPKGGFFDFDSKYSSSKTEYIVPAKISPILESTLQSVALKAYRLFCCSDFARVDLLLDEDLNHYVLEVNTVPGFTATSLLPKAAKQSGLNFVQLCLKILELAYGKKKENI